MVLSQNKRVRPRVGLWRTDTVTGIKLDPRLGYYVIMEKRQVG